MVVYLGQGQAVLLTPDLNEEESTLPLLSC